MSPQLIPPHSVRKPYTHSPPSSIVTILSSVLELMGFFLTSCVGINLVPLVDPSTLGRKTLYALASLKYCYNTDFAPFYGPFSRYVGKTFKHYGVAWEETVL